MQASLAKGAEKDSQQEGHPWFQKLAHSMFAATFPSPLLKGFPCSGIPLTFATLSSQHSCLQVSEAHLMRFMGGRLGAQAAAVEALMEMLPEVLLVVLLAAEAVHCMVKHCSLIRLAC